ncbi:MAG: hypothetical protein R3362_02065 [Rhodothermales bacterium]|nr:hypothetical protein [Rhodothermales bacterium]
MPTPLATVDEALASAHAHDPDSVVDVILLTAGPDSVSEAALAEAGFEPTGRDEAEHGLLYGRLPLRRLPELQRVPGVKHVSADDPQHAF